MVRKQVLPARELARENLLGNVKSGLYQKKLTFKITYYPVFENVRNILQKLHILLTPGQEHKKVSQDIPVVGFRNGKSLKDHLVRPKLPNVEITGSSESVRFVTLYAIQTLSTKACGERFRIQSGTFNCDSQKVVYLLKCRIYGEAPYVGKAKTKFRASFNDYKSAHRSYRKKRKVSQQRVHEHCGQHIHNWTDDWKFTLIKQCETHEQLKEMETFWQHRLKTFYPYGLNEKKEYLY